MKYLAALKIAGEVKAALAPHCDRIEIAGSIRRKCAECGDVEIVAIPKPYDSAGMFVTGIATVINEWEKVIGELPCKYTQRLHPSGIKLDIFFADRINWGYVFAMRTGPAEYSKTVLAYGWRKQGYTGAEGYLRYGGRIQPVLEETDLFNLIKIPYCSPEARKV